MQMVHWASVIAFGLVAVLTIALGVYATRVVRTTPDFFVASRAVGPILNASAISGEYLSAASFMGAAALVMRFGYDMLWFPAGYAAGYLLLLLFVAAPLRRFGAYTIPDFAEGRFDSPLFRRVAVAFVLVIGLLYMLPQMKGAGLTVQVIAGGSVPYWLGVVLVGSIISLNVALGGMKGITLVQAFQYWLKLFAISIPAFVLLAVFGSYGEQLNLAVTRDIPGDTPGSHWAQPFGSSQGEPVHALVFTYSLMAATIFGTAGLPHILVRFYTNRSGHAARQTTLAVLALIGAFYLFPPILGTIGRAQVDRLGPLEAPDALILELPGLLGGTAGELVRAVVAAGAFAAFMSTTSGLLVAVAGALAHDLYARTFTPNASPAARQRAFQVSALGAGVVAIVLGLHVERFPITVLVGWAFAIAASSFFPLLTLGIWWRGLTLPGAIAGTCLGGAAASASILYTMVTALDGGGGAYPSSLAGLLLAQPAIWSIPLAFSTMVVVSQATRERIPADVSLRMLRFHVPEGLGLGTVEYVAD